MTLVDACLWVSFVVAASAAYPIFRLLLLTKSRQTIDPHAPETHQVKQGTPTMGGLIVWAGVLAGMGTFLALSPQTPYQLAQLLLFIGFGTIGFLDDYVVPKLTGSRGFKWLPKLALQILVAVGVSWMSAPNDGLRIGVMVFAILFFTNAFNFADGLDALAGSLWLGLAAGILMVGAGWALPMVLSITGGTLVFLFLNAPPAKVFMGDVGSLPIGACLGWFVADQLVPTKGVPFTLAAVTSMLLLSLVMIAELVPVPIQVGYYKLTKKRLFPMTPIHHAFEKVGWKETRIVWCFFVFQLICSLGAYQASQALRATMNVSVAIAPLSTE